MTTATMELEEQAGEATSELSDLERLRNVIVPDANGSNGADDDDNPHGDESDADTDSYPHDAYLAIREALMPGKTRKPFGDAKKRTDFDERMKAALGAIASVATILSEEDNEALNAHPSIARLAALVEGTFTGSAPVVKSEARTAGTELIDWMCDPPRGWDDPPMADEPEAEADDDDGFAFPREDKVRKLAAASGLPVWERHELSRVWGDQGEDEFEELKTSITTFGQLDPIELMDGVILDGEHRYSACIELGIEPIAVEVSHDDPAGYVIAKNLHRRHKELNAGQRALKVIQSYEFRPHGDQSGEDGITIEDAAVKAGVSRSTFVIVQRIRRAGRDGEIEDGTKTATQIIDELREAERIAEGVKKPVSERTPRAAADSDAPSFGDVDEFGNATKPMGGAPDGDDGTVQRTVYVDAEKHDAVVAANEGLERKANSLTAELEAASAKVATLEAAVAGDADTVLIEQTHTLEAEKASLKSSLDEAMSNQSGAAHTVESQRGTIRDLRAKIDELVSERDTATNSADNAKQSVRDLKARVGEYEQMIEDVKSAAMRDDLPGVRELLELD